MDRAVKHRPQTQPQHLQNFVKYSRLNNVGVSIDACYFFHLLSPGLFLTWFKQRKIDARPIHLVADLFSQCLYFFLASKISYAMIFFFLNMKNFSLLCLWYPVEWYHGHTTKFICMTSCRVCSSCRMCSILKMTNSSGHLISIGCH